MNTTDEIKKAELRGYSRGYAAGKKKVKIERSAEQRRAEQQAFLDKAFFAALPFAATQSTWRHGEKPINTITERVALAWDFAESSLRQRRKA
jgi:hypothetical protein